MDSLKVYLAGKVDPNSPFVGFNWREAYCDVLKEKTSREVINLNPSRETLRFPLDEGDSRLIFGRDCFMIREADIVVVNLTDDISVGGSQEMLIAKYFAKPLYGLVAPDGKFRGSKKIREQVYDNYVHPFVEQPCDELFADIIELGDYLRENLDPVSAKDLTVIDKSIKYYIDRVLEQSIVIQ